MNYCIPNCMCTVRKFLKYVSLFIITESLMKYDTLLEFFFIVLLLQIAFYSLFAAFQNFLDKLYIQDTCVYVHVDVAKDLKYRLRKKTDKEYDKLLSEHKEKRDSIVDNRLQKEKWNKQLFLIHFVGCQSHRRFCEIVVYFFEV